MDVLITQKIESALMTELSIADCTTMVRSAERSADVLIIFFIPQGPVNPQEILSIVNALLGKSKLTVQLVPLFKFPLTSEGTLDLDALSKIPVLDDCFIDRGEQMLRSRPGVRNAAIVGISRRNVDESRYHLNDLLPSPAPERNLEKQSATSAEQTVSTRKTHDPALINGAHLTNRHEIENSTLLDLLRRASTEFNNRAIRFVASNGDVTEWSYSELLHQAERIHSGLLASGLKAGDKVVFQLHDNSNILSTFWACQIGGFIPVIMEVPTDFHAGNQTLERVLSVLQLLKYPLLAMDEMAASSYNKAKALLPRQELSVCRIDTIETLQAERQTHAARPDDIAFFNLSSGSTGIPKCIMLTHRNLLTRAAGTNQLCGYSGTDIILNWLPFDHIGSISDWHIRCVLLGCDLVYVDKAYVLGQPINWLNLIDRFRVSHSWAPNFAFSLINKQLEAEQAPDWDLSCVKGLLTAGEAVSDSSVQNFIRILAKHGLRPDAVQPAFGMAELGSGITYFVPSETNPLRFHSVRKPSMGCAVEPVSEGHPEATHFADLGPPIPGVSLRIVDQEGQVMPVDTVGRLQVKGDVVFQGYFENPEANAASLQTDGWFNTGDLGFLSQGNLVLTGREKETIIIKGANYYSHEIEDMVARVEGVEPSYTAATGVQRDNDSEEKLAIFFVPEQPERETELVRSIRTQIANRFGISPTYLIPLEKRQIPKTAIGKIQRNQLKQQLESGQFNDIVKRVDLILANANTLPKWFFRTTWLPKRTSHIDHGFMTGTVLILMDKSGLAIALAERMQKHICVEVTPGAEFTMQQERLYTVDPHSKEHFQKLFYQLTGQGIGICQVISLIDYSAPDKTSSEKVSDISDPVNVSCFLHMAQVILETNLVEPLRRIIWVASDSQCLNTDEPGQPGKVMMTGFTRTFRLEHPELECCHVDLASADHLSNADFLYAELTGLSKETSVCYRNGQRHVSRLAHLDLLDPAANPRDLKQGGLYLVTGGLGGLGYELCRKLGRQYRARIVIIGRRSLSPADGQQDRKADSHQKRFQSLLDDRIECAYVQADVGDRNAVDSLVQNAESSWGQTLNGIFHLAGIAQETSLDRESIDNVKTTTRPKCEGTLALGDLLTTRPNTFLVAFSSVNAFFGGSNTGAYSAANVFMEAVCRQLFRSGHAAMCYAWSQWDGLGMSSHSATQAIAAAKGFRPIAQEEGLNSLLSLLHLGCAEAIVGLDSDKNPVQVMIADDRYEQQSAIGFLQLDQSTDKPPIPESATLADCFGNSVDCRIETLASLPLTEHGDIDKKRLLALSGLEQHVKKKPVNAIEAKIIQLWRDLLHVTDIGTQDNFFELGGDSLLTVQLVVQIGKAFHQEIPASAIFHAPTVEQLAAVLSKQNDTPDLFSLVPIKATGSKPPLYIIQSDSWELVRHLDPDQPVYGLNYGVGAKSAESRLKLPESLEDLAAHFIQEIRMIQPSGPYFLIGHSNAGILAYEMAQQLVAQQEIIGMLGMIDTWYIPGRINEPKISVGTKIKMLYRLPIKTSLLFIRKRIAYQFRLARRRFFTKKSDLPFLHRAMHLYKNYLPKPYPGKISYFKCFKQARLQPIGNDEQDWQKLAEDGVRLHLIACGHQEVLFEPYVKLLAEQINRNL